MTLRRPGAVPPRRRSAPTWRWTSFCPAATSGRCPCSGLPGVTRQVAAQLLAGVGDLLGIAGSGRGDRRVRPVQRRRGRGRADLAGAPTPPIERRQRAWRSRMASAPSDPPPGARPGRRRGPADRGRSRARSAADGGRVEPRRRCWRLPQVAAVARLARKLGIPVARPAIAAASDHDLELWVRAMPGGRRGRAGDRGLDRRAPAAPRLASLLGGDEPGRIVASLATNGRPTTSFG